LTVNFSVLLPVFVSVPLTVAIPPGATLAGDAFSVSVADGVLLAASAELGASTTANGINNMPTNTAV
jgi:hypothetical protein